MCTFRLIKLNAFRIFLSFSILMFSCARVIAQAVPDPSYANVQRATGGILQQRGQSMGYAANDPKMYGTWYGFGRAATSVAAGAGTALAVGTSPAWGSVIAVAAVSSAVSYGVWLGIDKLFQLVFGTGSTPITIIDSQPVSTNILKTGVQAYVTANPLSGSLKYKFDLPDTASYSPCYVPANPGSGFFYVETPAVAPACSQYNGRFSITGYNASTDTCPTGTASSGWAFCTQSAAVTQALVTANQTMQQAVNAIRASEMSQKVNYDVMALLINNLWQQAASQAGYTGIPYSATNPITSAEVATWAAANPTTYPTVSSLVAPVPSTDPAGFYPSTTSAAGTTLSPATGSSPSTTTTTTTSTSGNTTTTTSTVTGTAQPVTVTNKVSVDLGADPAIGSPTLETTPTASTILAPVLNLFPSFKNFSVPSHTSDCPKPTFDAFGKHFVMDTHCTLFEQQRATLYSTMTLAFMLIAIFIVLSA